MVSRLQKIGVVFTLTAAAACTPVPPPVVAPPPPPVYVPPPPPPPAQPLPPGGAAVSFMVPPVGVDGVRETPNRNISSNEAVWNLRSAINVAALNCRGPVWDQIADNYNVFLKNNRLTLRKISRNIDAEYRKRYPGQNAARIRDTKLTDLYNYFSLPAVKQEYCDMALLKSQEAAAVDWRVIKEFGVGALAEIDGIFIRFFNAYAQYEADLAEWNRLYGLKELTPEPAGFAPAEPALDPVPILEVPVDPSGPVTPPTSSGD